MANCPAYVPVMVEAWKLFVIIWSHQSRLSDLARRQDADGPDVHGGRAVLTAQEDPALVDVGGHRLIVRGERGVVSQNTAAGVLAQSSENNTSDTNVHLELIFFLIFH